MLLVNLGVQFTKLFQFGKCNIGCAFIPGIHQTYVISLMVDLAVYLAKLQEGEHTHNNFLVQVVPSVTSEVHRVL